MSFSYITLACTVLGKCNPNGDRLKGNKGMCLHVSSRLWGGVLRDDPVNGCEGD